MVTEGPGTTFIAASVAVVPATSSTPSSQSRGTDPFTLLDPWVSYNDAGPRASRTPRAAEHILNPHLRPANLFD
eukprot:3873771-Lingulodinium_polyedra.AAC.1